VPGPLLEGVTYILFVSDEVKKKVGLEVKELDMTSDDFLQYAKAVANYNETHSDKVTFLSSQLGSVLNILFSQLVLSSYGKNEPGMREEGLAAVEKAYNYLEELSKYKPFEQFGGYAGDTWDASKRALHEDKFLFSMQPTWIYLLWEKSNPGGVKKLIPCEIPSMNGGVSPYYFGFYQFIFVVPKHAKNREGAEKFIEFISSSETADKWIGYSKCPTGLASGISYTDFGQNKFDIFFRHIQEKYGNNQKDINLSNYLFKTDKTINFSVNEVITGKMSAKEALNNVMKQIR
jgi:ABC-type glycerol-3-phosphate transport system substrate-binding protein